jgi:hypothetical protein
MERVQQSLSQPEKQECIVEVFQHQSTDALEIDHPVLISNVSHHQSSLQFSRHSCCNPVLMKSAEHDNEMTVTEHHSSSNITSASSKIRHIRMDVTNHILYI